VRLKKMDTFQNKYRIKTARYEGHDYSQNGYYFVTICVKDKQEYFGEVVNGEMKLSEVGKSVNEEWAKTEKIRKNVKLDKFVVMLNHLHGIVIIEDSRDALNASPKIGRRTQCVSTDENCKNKFGPQTNNLASIIRGFKSASTKIIRNTLPYFQWQSRFYDRVIRNETELGKIQEYIERNPKFWDEDKNKVENIFY